MAKYLMVFYGGTMETDPKKAEKSMATWLKWYKDLGKAVIDIGAPTQPGKIIGSSGIKTLGQNPVTGYSILQAENLDAAVALSKNCPIIANGGQVAVYTLMPMPV
jgi:hypothetical protein